MNKIDIINKYVFYPNVIHWEYENSDGMWKSFEETCQYFIDNHYMRNLSVCEMYVNDVYYFLLFDESNVVILDKDRNYTFKIRRIDLNNTKYERGVKNIFKERKY